jgi:hypothetical protein
MGLDEQVDVIGLAAVRSPGTVASASSRWSGSRWSTWRSTPTARLNLASLRPERRREFYQPLAEGFR